MSTSPNSDPRLERHLRCDSTRPRELTTTPVEHFLTATQERRQRTPQLGLENIIEDTPIEENNPTPIEAPDPVTNSVPNTPLNFGNLDIHALLTALAQQATPLVWKRTKGVKEPDLFSGRSPDELRAFIFQCQIYFRACEGEFKEDTEKIFFAILYLRGVALDYFEPFISKEVLV